MANKNHMTIVPYAEVKELIVAESRLKDAKKELEDEVSMLRTVNDYLRNQNKLLEEKLRDFIENEKEEVLSYENE